MTKFFFALIVLSLGAYAGAQGFDWEAIGEATYANCAGCHQTNGKGVPGVFPSLAGHLPNIVAKQGGRSYLIQVLLFGLQGEINVLGQALDGAMPAWGASLSDEQIAAVLNHELHNWGNADLLPADFALILPEEVAALRNEGLNSSQTYELRTALELDPSD